MPRAKQHKLLLTEPETRQLFGDWPYDLPDEKLNHQAALKAGVLSPSWDAKTPLERLRAKEEALASLLQKKNRTRPTKAS